MLVPETVDVGLSAWIVQDGNYPEFAVGRQASFALEVWLREFSGFADNGSQSLKLLSGSASGDRHYEIEAEVIHSDSAWVALDAGIRAYIDTPIFEGAPIEDEDPVIAEFLVLPEKGIADQEDLDFAEENEVVSSSATLIKGPSADPYRQYADWGVKPGSWVSGKVTFGVDHFAYFERLGLRAGSPAMIYDWKVERIQIETAPFVTDSLGLNRRDESKLAWKDVKQTNCWEDDGGRAEYVLTCRRMPGEPRNRI